MFFGTGRKKGFTIIELLVVISIIGVLAALILVGLRVTRARAQDVQRKSDIRSIRTALTAYAGDNSEKYPLSNGDGAGWEGLSNDSSTGIKLLSDGLLGNIPQDRDGEYYSYFSDGNGFELKSKLAAEPGQSYVVSDSEGSGGGTVSSYVDTSAPLWDTEFSMVSTADHAVMILDRQAGKVRYMWDKAYDDNGVDNYRYRYAIAGTGDWHISELQTVNYADITGLDISKAYDFIVYAYDMVGNESRISVNHMPRERRIDLSASGIAPDWGTGMGYTVIQASDNIITVSVEGNNTDCPVMRYMRNGSNDAIAGMAICDRPTMPISGQNALSAHLPVGNYHFWIYNMNLGGDLNPLVKEFDYNIAGRLGDTIKPIMKNSLLNDARKVEIRDNGDDFTISWQAAGDNIRPNKYHITIKSYTDPSFDESWESDVNSVTVMLERAQSYNIKVFATDSNGNESNISGANFGISG